MRLPFTFLVMILSTSVYSQTPPFGKYYTLPKGEDINSGTSYIIREIEISENSFSENYLNSNLTEIANTKDTKNIDTSFYIGNEFYGIYKNKVGYFYREFLFDKGNKERPLKMRDNFLNLNFETKNDVYNYINYLKYCDPADHNNCFPATYMPLYTKKAVLSFKKYKAIENIDSTLLLKILKKIVKQMDFENEIRNSLTKPSRDKYNLIFYHNISYLEFFVEEGISPFITSSKLEKLKRKYSKNKEIINLFRQMNI